MPIGPSPTPQQWSHIHQSSLTCNGKAPDSTKRSKIQSLDLSAGLEEQLKVTPERLTAGKRSFWFGQDLRPS